MGTGSRTLNYDVPKKNENFSGTTFGTTPMTLRTSWDFPSPRAKPKSFKAFPTPGTYVHSWDNYTPGVRVLGAGLSKNTRTGVPKFLLGTNFVQEIVNDDSLSEANASVTQALARFSTGDLNLGNLLGELKSSFAMIIKRIGSINSIFSAVKSADFTNFEKSKLFLDSQSKPSAKEWGAYKKRMKNLPMSKRLANGHLEVMFGWLPLLSDVYNATDNIHKALRGNGSVVSGTSSKFKSSNGLKARSGVTGIVQSSSKRTLAELGLLNPLAVAWELTPFSFVLDYFVKIGELLSTSTFNIGMRDVFIWKLHEERVRTYRSGTSGSYSYPSTLLSTSRYAFRNVSPASVPPIPRLVVPKLNLSQVSTSIALLIQKLR